MGDRDFLPFQNIEESVREDMRLLKVSPLIPEDVVISGAVYDVDTGLISEVNDHIEENRKRERSLFPVLFFFIV